MKHNKKRNVGIIYEQLSQAFSESLINGNKKKSILIKKIIEDHYKKESEIFKEFKIFNALIKVEVGSDSLASKILDEAKDATRNLSRKKLDIEKSLLIKDINYTLNESSFYSRKVKNYKNLATVQTLMNMWTVPSKQNFQKLAEYENKAHYILREEKVRKIEKVDPNIDSLVLKIMQEKFSKKYKPILSPLQSKIIETYVFGNEEKTAKLLSEVKASSINSIKSFEATCSNKILLEKSTRVITNIECLDETLINDENISKFLLACKLREQIEDNNE